MKYIQLKYHNISGENVHTYEYSEEKLEAVINETYIFGSAEISIVEQVMAKGIYDKERNEDE